MKPKPSPVRHGNGGGVPIDEQARHFTADCLLKLQHLLDAKRDVLTKDGMVRDLVDYRLQFTVARYLLELGWGRTPVRNSADADVELSEDELEKLNSFVGAHEQRKRAEPDTAASAAKDEGPQLLAGNLSRSMG